MSKDRSASRWRASYLGFCAVLILAQLLRGLSLATPGVRSTTFEFAWSLQGFVPSIPLSWFPWIQLLYPLLSALAYLGAVSALPRCDLEVGAQRKWVLVPTAFGLGLGLATTSFLSSDIFLYHLLGVVQLASDNPYLVGLNGLDQAQLAPYFPDGFGLANTVVYGPALLLLNFQLSLISGGGVSFGLFLLKLLSVLLFCGLLYLLWSLGREFGAENAERILRLTALNPLLMTELVFEGHNELVIIFTLVLALWLELRGKTLLAVALLALAAFMKVTTGLFFLFFCLYLVRSKKPGFILAAAGFLAVFAAFFTVRYQPDGIAQMFSNLRTTEQLFTNSFLSSVLFSLRGFWTIIDSENVPTLALAYFFLYLARAGRFAVALPLYRFCRVGHNAVEYLALHASQAYLLLYLFGTMFLWPHYFSLPLVLGILASRKTEPRAAIYLSLAVPYLHLTHAFSLDFAQRGYVSVPLYLPAIWLLVQELRSKAS